MQTRMLAQGYLDGAVTEPAPKPGITSLPRREILRGA
jgi:hypothetical protein